MHVIHLGTDLSIAGNTLKALLEFYGAWGDGSHDERLYRAWREFKSWTRQRKIASFGGQLYQRLNVFWLNLAILQQP